MSRRHTALAAALLLAAALAGCGKVGRLERPGPMFGGHSAAPQEGAPRVDSTRSVQTVDPRDRSNDDFPAAEGATPPAVPTVGDDAPATARPR